MLVPVHRDDAYAATPHEAPLAYLAESDVAWRMGHALRLIVAREHMLDGAVEIDHFHLGGRPRKHPDAPPPRRGRKGQANTQKTPVMAMVQRLNDTTPGTPAGDARAAAVTGLSLRAAERAIEARIAPHADEAKAFMAIGESFAKHEAVKHSVGSGCRPREQWQAVAGDLPIAQADEAAQFIIDTAARTLARFRSSPSAG